MKRAKGIIVSIMTRLRRAFAGFLLGGFLGAIIGALCGTMARGSMFILVPSGPPFWAIVGMFFGSILGTLFGALMKLSSHVPNSLTSDGFNDRIEKHKTQ
jgi:ABC-type nitrate/sulfonate/bicarbonate transport system permease component